MIEIYGEGDQDEGIEDMRSRSSSREVRVFPCDRTHSSRHLTPVIQTVRQNTVQLERLSNLHELLLTEETPRPVARTREKIDSVEGLMGHKEGDGEKLPLCNGRSHEGGQETTGEAQAEMTIEEAEENLTAINPETPIPVGAETKIHRETAETIRPVVQIILFGRRVKTCKVTEA